MEASPEKHYQKPATGVVCTRVFLRLFLVAVCPQHLLKGEVSAGQVCLHLMFTCELASGTDCSWKQEEREAGKGRKVEMKHKNLQGRHAHLLYLPGHLNATLEVHGMALSITGFYRGHQRCLSEAEYLPPPTPGYTLCQKGIDSPPTGAN